jgi:lysophospholipase L1-like esterase
MHVCFVGDSLVNGMGDPECLGWAGRLIVAARRQGHDVTHDNLGIRRDTSADVRARWADEVGRRLGATGELRLVFSFGVNDTTWEGGGPRVAPDSSALNAREVLAAAQQLAPVIMVGPSPVADPQQNRRIADLSLRLTHVCAGLGVPYLDVFPDLDASDVWMIEVTAGDGAHPGVAGYAELARLVGAWASWRAWLS